MSYKTKFTLGKDWWKDPIVIFSISIILISGTIIGTAYGSSSVSGYQSVTAEFYQVYWPYAQDTTKTFVKPLDGPTLSWNADATGVETKGLIPDGSSDLPTITGSVENPKFDRNIEYHDWWVNDTVSTENPEGVASHYEWAIDIYTMNVNFYAYQSTTYFTSSKPQVWVELQNNVKSVFENLGADAAASYIIYAQTEKYTYTPEDAGWHIIQPDVGNFKLMFLDGNIAVPTQPQEGSNLDFENLKPYSHIAISFEMEQFGQAYLGSAPTVNMIVELNILTVGRFDYVLTYVAGGDNDISPIGEIGLFAGIGAALGAGYSALMDGLSDLGDSFTGPLISIAIIAIVVFASILLIRMVLIKKTT